MRLSDAIYGRVTIREFSSRTVPKEDIKKIIDAAIRAPSACDIQGWKYIIVTSAKLKERLVNEGTISFIRKAPLGILVLYDNQTEDTTYQDYMQSASASIQNMILTAHSLGIGCCWVCHLPSKERLRKILKIPPQYDPIAYVAMGYYDKKPKNRPRKYSVNDVISYNSFNFRIIARKRATPIFKRALTNIYRVMPFKKYLLPITKKFEKFN